MREIFLEEAREVIETARAAGAELPATPDDLELLTTVRRAFHTLKGSSRMVGLKTSAKPRGPASSSTTRSWPSSAPPSRR